MWEGELTRDAEDLVVQGDLVVVDVAGAGPLLDYAADSEAAVAF